MYFLIWINDFCEPGRMYGPGEPDELEKIMLSYAKEDKVFYEDSVHEKEYGIYNEETGEGWYIVKSEPLE